MMKPQKSIAGLGTFASLLVLGLILFPVTSHGFDITIDVAPNVLNLGSSGTVVTVHTNISYHLVDAASLSMNGVEISGWKADNRGNFVAKFPMNAIKNLPGLVIGDYNTLRLNGLTTGGEPFTGEQEIMVIDVGPRRR